MFTWASLARTVLTVFARIMEVVKTKQLMDAGEQRQIAKQLAEIEISTGLAKVVEEEVAALTDQAVRDALENEGGLRD